jgi:hypothetical protein
MALPYTIRTCSVQMSWIFGHDSPDMVESGEITNLNVVESGEITHLIESGEITHPHSKIWWNIYNSPQGPIKLTQINVIVI